MSAAKLGTDRRNVGRTQLEELLAVELAQPRRQGLLPDESQGEGGHGIAGSAVGSVNVLPRMSAQLSDQCSSTRHQPQTRMDAGPQTKTHQSARKVRLPLIARRIATYKLWVCASPQYLKEQGTPASPDELSKHRLIAHADRRSAWRFKASDKTVVEFDLMPGCVVPEPAVVRTMLLGGAGIGQLPDFAALDAIADGTLVRLFPDHDVDTVDAHALYTSHRSMSAKLRVFIDALIAGTSRPAKDPPRTRPSGAVPSR